MFVSGRGPRRGLETPPPSHGGGFGDLQPTNTRAEVRRGPSFRWPARRPKARDRGNKAPAVADRIFWSFFYRRANRAANEPVPLGSQAAGKRSRAVPRTSSTARVRGGRRRVEGGWVPRASNWPSSASPPSGRDPRGVRNRRTSREDAPSFSSADRPDPSHENEIRPRVGDAAERRSRNTVAGRPPTFPPAPHPRRGRNLGNRLKTGRSR